MSEIGEAMEVQKFIPDSAVERFNLSILGGLSGIGELKSDLVVCAPLQHRSTGEFASSIKPHRRREITIKQNALEYSDHVAASEREPYFDRQALTREVVDDDHGADRPAQPVMNEVHGPSFVWSRHPGNGIAADISNVSLSSWPHLKAELPVNSAQVPPRQRNVFTPQHDHQPAIAETWPALSKCLDLLDELWIFRRSKRTILRGSAWTLHE